MFQGIINLIMDCVRYHFSRLNSAEKVQATSDLITRLSEYREYYAEVEEE